ncbi:hypothetical protein HAX54_006799, partial [Datura stramonium]|nr:hypothetical protein [Datura stramonium]
FRDSRRNRVRRRPVKEEEKRGYGGGSLSMVALGSSEIGEEEGTVLFVFRPTVARINGGNSDMAALRGKGRWWCAGVEKREEGEAACRKLWRFGVLRLGGSGVRRRGCWS